MSPSSRLLIAASALLLIGAPLLAAPRPSLQPSTPAGVKHGPDDQHRTLSDAERKSARFHMDFDKVDITEVIKYVAQWTGRNFILADNIRGKITIIGPTDVSADEAYHAFLAALETNGLQVTPTGRFLKIEPKKDTIKSTIPTCLDAHCPIPLDEEMVTKLFRLKYTDVDQIKTVLGQFVGRDGEIDTFQPDVLIVSDNGLNVARIGNILSTLDQPGSQDEVNVVQLLHSTAPELSQTLLQIFPPQTGSSPQGGGGRRPMFSTNSSSRPGESGTVNVTKIIPDERSNKLIVIANTKSFEKVKDVIAKLDVVTNTNQVHVYYLENADATELATTLTSMVSGIQQGSSRRPGAGGVAPPPVGSPGESAGGGALFSGQVKVTADKATNSLLIVASQNDYRNMLKVIDKLDIRRRQVFIECVIMEVTLNDENTLNFNGHTGLAAQGISVPGATTGVAPIIIGSEESAAGASLSLANLASLQGFIAGIQGPPITIAGLNITLPAFGVVMNALQTNSDVNVISSPHILTTDNQDAEISVGETVPFQSAVPLGGLSSLAGLSSSTTSSTSSIGSLGLGGLLGGYVPVQRTPVELRVKIKPHINESDYVKMEIDISDEQIASSNAQLGPTTSKRAIKATIVAKDQSSVVIGGLVQEQTTHSESQTPILGEIPVIGALFRSDDVVRQKTNLLVFLTPYVIRDESDFREIFERKMRERQEFVTRYFGTTDQYQARVDYAHKHGPLSVLIRSIKEEFLRVENGGPGVPGEEVFIGNPATMDKTPGKADKAPEGTDDSGDRAPPGDSQPHHTIPGPDTPQPETPDTSTTPSPDAPLPDTAAPQDQAAPKPDTGMTTPPVTAAPQDQAAPATKLDTSTTTPPDTATPRDQVAPAPQPDTSTMPDGGAPAAPLPQE